VTITTTAPSGGPADDPTDELVRTWGGKPGLPGWLTAVNHKQIGARFIVTAFGFLLIAGAAAVVMRTQLAVPEARVVGPQGYNELFTMHGTTMLFLFAVPILEGLAMYLVPLMIGARDLPFPRLNAFGYWTYLFGGLLLYASIFTGSVPDGGWYNYVPLAGPEASPGSNIDFWLLGVTMLEISGIVGAIELIVVILRHRAPGMSIERMPLFVWSSLVMAVMILFAFTAILTASLLLELERKLGLPFYRPEGGGNPLLWQHLFWIFGHPEVYIMLVPATGIVSAIVTTHARRPVFGYAWVVAALVGIGVLSFGLWVHHMFTVGIPMLALSFFGVASILIAIPSGVQIFAWLATLWSGRPRWDTPLLYVGGFVVIFVLGGVTGVMVASPPFDWQAHDTYFIVAHFHYVILGGVVFPIFGGLHHWLPKMTGRMPSEKAGKASFWLFFVGFNVAFFPLHHVGFLGMPRRVYTYQPGLGWDWLNFVSTMGTYVMTVGIAIFTGNLLWSWFKGPKAPDDPWGGESLEWAVPSPAPVYNFRTVPLVVSREPMWDPARPGEGGDEEDLLLALAEPHERRREQVITSAVEGRFLGVTRLAGPSYWPLFAAIAVAVLMIGILTDFYVLAGLGLAGTVVSVIGWLRPPHREAAS
jgi:cytochrome c oxidase subunit I+III